MKTMHLFAGGGGGMYADLILGHTPVVAVEWEKAACDVLRARKEEGWWPECEIIEGDIRAFSGTEYAGKVDCIHAGFPCQDLSVAGKRAGLDGDRSSLYVEALRIFCEVRPRYLFLENVPGILTANGGEALNRVMSDLAALGLDARWCCISAGNVGAKHERNRWWLLASDTFSDRLQKVQGKKKIRTQANRKRSGRQFTAMGGETLWSGPLPNGAVPVGMGDGMAGGINRLKMLGNGQVPLQAAYAWVMLGGPTDLKEEL